MSELNVRHIVVDGDACPVKAEIAETARRFKIPVLLVSSFDHLLQGGEGVQTVQVDRSDQSADLYIANHIKPCVVMFYLFVVVSLTIVTLISCLIPDIRRPKREKEVTMGKAQSLSQSRIVKYFNIN